MQAQIQEHAPDFRKGKLLKYLSFTNQIMYSMKTPTQ